MNTKHKNRKKTLRRRFLKGNINETEYKLLLAASRYLNGIEDIELVAETWLEENIVPSDTNPNIEDVYGSETFNCSASCLAAKKLQCKCDCLGVNHGVVTGLKPGEITVLRYSRIRRVELGLLRIEDYLECLKN